MIEHSPDHEATRDFEECFVCAGALRYTFNSMGLGDLIGGPNGAERLMTEINRIAGEFVAHGAAS